MSVQGSKVAIAVPDSVGYYRNITDEKNEFERKVRTVVRGISVFMKSLPMLNPFKYGLFSWQLFSHKLCRWLVPFAMIALFISNLLLVTYSKSILYTFFFITQMMFYLVALIGSVSKTFAVKKFTKLPSFFIVVNMSIFVAWLKYISGDRMVLWEPSKR